jgi:hypothetical protein
MPLAGVIGGWYNINDLFVGLWILIYVIWRFMGFDLCNLEVYEI